MNALSAKDMPIRTKRIYEDEARTDGYRVLVDRLWPRGVRKEDAGIDLWLKSAAPSTELRKWFNHDPVKWTEFRERFQAELDERDEPLAPVREKLDAGETVTLLYASRDLEHNHALVLADILSENK